jgi:phage terminase large subunit
MIHFRPPTTTTSADWPPNYRDVFAWRQQQLIRLRRDPKMMLGAKAYYARNPVAFINHWCDTYDPRNAGKGKLTRMPLVMFQRQAELIEFLTAALAGEENGLIEKCRDMGATWVCSAFSVWLWLFKPGAAVGWGSRKQEYVDKLGDSKSIFEKIRLIIRYLPPDFLPQGFEPARDMPFMRIINPQNGASIVGEAGDNMGRGGRTLIYFKDESAHYQRPEMIEAALADNTRVQIDISSVNGLGNVFHRKREAGVEWNGGAAIEGRTNLFIMDWADHPEKDQEWYETRKAKAIADGLGHVFAQEVERNYAAALQGAIIKPEWVKAAIDAHKVLGFEPEGGRVAGLDVADDGLDRNAWAERKGVVLLAVDEWSERDTGVTARKAAKNAEGKDEIEIQYDCIGVGAGVKAEANRLIDEKIMPRGVSFVAWSASAAALNPNDPVIEDDEDSPSNRDFFQNIKAQGWWMLARRFHRTYQAVVEGIEHAPDDLISIDSRIPKLRTIEKELCQPTMGKSAQTMKTLVNKAPEGTASPNIADAIMMAFWPVVDNAPVAQMFLRKRRT